MYNAAPPKQKQCLDSLIMFVARDLLPLSIFESKHFLKLIHYLDSKFQVPSRKPFSTKLLQEKAREIQRLLKEQLKNAEHIYHTVDLWSNRFSFGVPGFASSVVKDNEEEFFTDSGVEDTGDEEEHPFSFHKRCYAHCLQLVIKDAFDKSDNSLSKIIVKA